MEAEALLNTAARAQMRQRDPGVLRVPDNRRDCAKSKNSEEQIQAGPRKLLSEPRSQREHKQNRHKLERVRIFGEKSKANQQSSEQPIQ